MNKKNLLTIILFCITFLAPLRSESFSICAIEELKTWKPYQQRVLILQDIYELILNKAVQVKYYPSLRALHYSNSGICDAEVERLEGAITEGKYPNLLKVRTSSAAVSVNIISKMNISGKTTLGKLKDFCKYSPTYYKYILPIHYALNSCKNAIPVKNYKRMIKLLESGHSQMAFILSVNTKNITTDGKLPYGHNVIPSTLKMRSYHYIHKKHKKLITRINAMMRRYGYSKW